MRRFKIILSSAGNKMVIANIYYFLKDSFCVQVTRRLTEIKAVTKPEDRGVGMQILESLYRYRSMD